MTGIWLLASWPWIAMTKPILPASHPVFTMMCPSCMLYNAEIIRVSYKIYTFSHTLLSYVLSYSMLVLNPRQIPNAGFSSVFETQCFSWVTTHSGLSQSIYSEVEGVVTWVHLGTLDAYWSTQGHTGTLDAEWGAQDHTRTLDAAGVTGSQRNTGFRLEC